MPRRDPATRAEQLRHHADDLEYRVRQAIIAALDTADDVTVQPTYARIASALRRDVAAAWVVTGDAYEEAGDSPNAGWARRQAQIAHERALKLSRVRFLLTLHHRRGDSYKTPASAYEVGSELRVGAWEIVRDGPRHLRFIRQGHGVAPDPVTAIDVKGARSPIARLHKYIVSGAFR